jgi:hypothetical protein
VYRRCGAVEMYKTLDLTEGASAKLDTMIGDLSYYVGEKSYKKTGMFNPTER